MTYEDDVDPQRITRVMRDNVEALSSTADMIDVLVAEAERIVHDLQKHIESVTTIQVDDWRTIKAFLRLAAAQADIVKDTSDAFHNSKLEPVA